MTLIRWNPARQRMMPTVAEWDRLMSDFVGDRLEDTELTNWTPAVDITEDNDSFVVTADLPGLTKKDISINIKENMLTISGERKSEIKDEKRNYCRTERRYGAFKRSFQLTDQVLADKITATFKDGVLTVDVTKAEEVKPKEIEIKVS
ncbi:MAG: Hsp20/alpha crystallin family protein [Candidatus Marinimicrobia bacterium]|nr:Hsp20/alpha crystallin family protein [Candidatus Neomarinimicrobiota bacterium]